MASCVALRKESVDRNKQSRNSQNIKSRVALRKESVDRNLEDRNAGEYESGVALRKESVDRNAVGFDTAAHIDASLSARRAWIEIFCPSWVISPVVRRSPQGERG